MLRPHNPLANKRNCVVAIAALFFSLLLLTTNYLLAVDATGKTIVKIDGETTQPSFGTTAGSWFFHGASSGSQALLLGFQSCGLDRKPNYRLTLDLDPRSTVELTIPSVDTNKIVAASCEVRFLPGFESSVLPKVTWILGSEPIATVVAQDDGSYRIDARFAASGLPLSLLASAPDYDKGANSSALCAVEISNFAYETAPIVDHISLDPERKPQSLDVVDSSPNFRPTLANALVEWDWRLQDGIGVEREPRSSSEALEANFPKLDALINDLKKTIDDSSFDSLASYDESIGDKFDSFQNVLEDACKTYDQLKEEYATLQSQKESSSPDSFEKETYKLWLLTRKLKRDILVNSPYFQFGKLLFLKHAPGIMSHQLTQVYGYCARPGGGIFLLDNPGKSMNAREITPQNLPVGSYMTPEISFDGQELLFAFCDAPSTPKAWRDPETMARRYHLYKASLSDLSSKLSATQLTDGDFDDFAPILLPDGDIAFCSTRRGGFHRCGGGPCYVYTLARCGSSGENPHPISFHETNEWFPTLDHQGRIVYTRWDYVDRDAVYYQQLWSARQDGADVRITYGNNTFNPPGFWEPKAVPGSDKIMAVGGPHHGMSAGSVALIDPNKGVDGEEPIERLTPETLYPEGEAPLPLIPQLPELCDFDYTPQNFWQAVRPAERAKETPESKRWPVQSYKSPYPLAEKYFIASYSYDKLLGEAGPNLPNQYGIYFCDGFGNKELIYRDPNISSVWAVPLRSRPTPPILVSSRDESRLDEERPTGFFFLQNVYESWPYHIPDKVATLRIVQVLPKTTPNANQPMVGAANASPGKQVIGTVPVEEDGSAFFEAPAKTPLLFQALDKEGRMIQGMRSLVYLQPGETAGCVGCHENRMASAQNSKTIASNKRPSSIEPGPDGSKPFSYPILVQPILDKKCVSCHSAESPGGNVVLTGEAEGSFSKSYNALVSRVAYTYWGAPEGNYEPRTEPDRFGARASKLREILEQGHYDVKLSEEEWERLNTWMDVNALFYGTFNPEQQARQQRGERIEGPDLE